MAILIPLTIDVVIALAEPVRGRLETILTLSSARQFDCVAPNPRRRLRQAVDSTRDMVKGVRLFIGYDQR